MRLAVVSTAAVLSLSSLVYVHAQGRQAAPAPAAQDPNGAIAVKDGGISVPGWMGKIDANEEKAGQVLNNSKLAAQGKDLHVTTGPAVNYWNPANKGTGDYTVKATFTENNYMGLNDHPHPYGIFIGGNDLGTANQSLLYCAAYGDGTFIVRGFSPAIFRLNGERPAANAAIHKAAGKGSSVTQEIAITVKDGGVSCSINGAVVATYAKADVIAAGKLKSTDGVFGIRFAHNTDAIVAGFGLTK